MVAEKSRDEAVVTGKEGKRKRIDKRNGRKGFKYVGGRRQVIWSVFSFERMTNSRRVGRKESKSNVKR